MCKAKRNRLQDSLHNDALGDVQADDRGGCNDVGQAEGVATGCPTELQGNECIRGQTCQGTQSHLQGEGKSLIEHQWTSMDINEHQVPCFLLSCQALNHNPKNNVYSHVFTGSFQPPTSGYCFLHYRHLCFSCKCCNMLCHLMSSSSRAIPAHPWPNFSAATF